MNNIKERQEFEEYAKQKLLGEGSFGKAYLVKRNSDQKLCVMKTIDISSMSETEKKDVLQESRLLEALSHPNIVRFIEVYKTKKGKLCIVMDYADDGDLEKKIKERKGVNFPESQVLDWFTQICLGIKHIHDRKVIHRDLKGQNIFLTTKGVVQIGDFGIAKVLAATLAKAKTVIGTPYYISPEIVQSQPYTLSTDIWSLGVILYEMCALKPPFDGNSLVALSMKIVKGAYNPMPSSFSQGIKSLVQMCLTVNPSKRPTINQILQLPIIQNRIKQYLSTEAIQNEFSHTILHKQNVFELKPQAPLQQIAEAIPPTTPLKSNQKPPQSAQTPQQIQRPQTGAQYGQRPESAMKKVGNNQQNVAQRPQSALQGGQGPKPAAPQTKEELQRLANAQAFVSQQKAGAISPGMAHALGQYGVYAQRVVPSARVEYKKVNYHYAQHNNPVPSQQHNSNQKQIPLSYQEAAQLARQVQDNQSPIKRVQSNTPSTDVTYDGHVAVKQQQKQPFSVNQNSQPGYSLQDVNSKLKQRENEIALQKAEREMQLQKEQQIREQNAELAYKRQIQKQIEQQKIQEAEEARERERLQKYKDEQQKLQQLEQARKQAFLDRQKMQELVAQRLVKEEQEKLNQKKNFVELNIQKAEDAERQRIQKLQEEEKKKKKIEDECKEWNKKQILAKQEQERLRAAQEALEEQRLLKAHSQPEQHTPTKPAQKQQKGQLMMGGQNQYDVAVPKQSRAYTTREDERKKIIEDRNSKLKQKPSFELVVTDQSQDENISRWLSPPAVAQNEYQSQQQQVKQHQYNNYVVDSYVVDKSDNNLKDNFLLQDIEESPVFQIHQELRQLVGENGAEFEEPTTAASKYDQDEAYREYERDDFEDSGEELVNESEFFEPVRDMSEQIQNNFTFVKQEQGKKQSTVNLGDVLDEMEQEIGVENWDRVYTVLIQIGSEIFSADDSLIIEELLYTNLGQLLNPSQIRKYSEKFSNVIV